MVALRELIPDPVWARRSASQRNLKTAAKIVQANDVNVLIRIGSDNLLRVIRWATGEKVRALIFSPTQGAPRRFLGEDNVDWATWERGVFGAPQKARCLIVAVNFCTSLRSVRLNPGPRIMYRDWRINFLIALLAVFEHESDALHRTRCRISLP